jgi:diguanylate cyclase (GGDEF)-like protein
VFAAISHRYVLFTTALSAYVVIFAAFLFFEVPGLGIAHCYYLPVAALAMTGGPLRGFLAGVIACFLYTFGILFNPDIPSAEILSASAGIRLVTYTAMGTLVGWFANHNRDLLDRLQLLAQRDHLTGLPNTRAFEAAVSARLVAGLPFALVLGDMDELKEVNDTCGHPAGNDAIRLLATTLSASIRPEDEVARVGGDEFAILTPLASPEDAVRLCNRLEAILDAQGTCISFGWSLFPSECANALALYRAADERLYARKAVRGQGGRGATIVALSS